MDKQDSTAPIARKWLRALGPAIIVAAVVLGPGSILTSSKVGCQYGYSMVWVLICAGCFMIGTTALASRLGLMFDGSLCDELAKRCGRLLAVFVGLTLFLIVACFQSSNNIAVVASLESIIGDPSEAAAGSDSAPWMAVISLVALNGLIIAAFLGFKRLYQPLERIMVVLVLFMLAAFAANLLFAKPSLMAFLQGLIPQLPFSLKEGLLPAKVDGTIVDPLWAMQGLIATTFSIGAAFYQAYLVREKGWTLANSKEAITDSVTGITVLVIASLMIMITSASVLYGVVAPEELRTAADIAAQLKPLFGDAANVLFLLGIFAGAISSFLVNAMVGGTLLSDGFGLGSRMDQTWPRVFTVVALLIGMAVALASTAGGMSRVGLIIFAQALTVLGGPVLAFSLLYLAVTSSPEQKAAIPKWMFGIALAGGVVTTGLAIRTAWRIALQMGVI